MQNMSSTSVKCYKGLGTILGAPDHPRSSASSLRRTLSADMSSKKWLAQNGFSSSSSSSPIKKTASTEQLHVDNNSCNSNDSQPSQLDIWNAIEADRHKAEQKKKQSDVWGSIIVSQKSSPILPAAPYVHPLSKRSRSLSQRSLEICTESLGSETGSDGYSSSCDAEQEQEQEQEQEEMEEEEEEEEEKEGIVKDELEYFLGRKPTHPISTSCRRSFPPPLPSLSRPGIHMRPRRVDGRLVLEAVSLPPPPSHNFHAQRHDGRLLLTFANPPSSSSSSTNGEGRNQPEVTNDLRGELTAPKNENTEEKQQSQNRQVLFGNDSKIVVEMMRPTVTPTGVIDVQLSAYRMKKLMTLTNMNPTPPTLSETPASPRVPRMISSSAASFNTYEYYWRTNKTTISLGIKGTLIQQPSLPFSTTTTTTSSLGTNKSYTNRSLLVTKNLNPQQQQQQHVHLHQFVVLQANYMDSTLRGCKDSRRTSALLFREPCCIATS